MLVLGSTLPPSMLHTAFPAFPVVVPPSESRRMISTWHSHNRVFRQLLLTFLHIDITCDESQERWGHFALLVASIWSVDAKLWTLSRNFPTFIPATSFPFPICLVRVFCLVRVKKIVAQDWRRKIEIQLLARGWALDQNARRFMWARVLKYAFFCLSLLCDAALVTPSGAFKLAFLFLTKGPMPLEPLWRRFFTWRTNDREYSIYVHPPVGLKLFQYWTRCVTLFDEVHSFCRLHIPNWINILREGDQK